MCVCVCVCVYVCVFSIVIFFPMRHTDTKQLQHVRLSGYRNCSPRLLRDVSMKILKVSWYTEAKVKRNLGSIPYQNIFSGSVTRILVQIHTLRVVIDL